MEEKNSIPEIRTYHDRLYSAGDSLFRCEFEAPWLMLLNEAQKAFYEKRTSLEQKKRFIENFWETYDPNPLLSDNVWLADFLERWRFVKERFSMRKMPGFDERGEYYLRYGAPDERFHELGAMYRVQLFADPNIHDLVMSLNSTAKAGNDMMARVPEYYEALANETWIYRLNNPLEGDQEMVVHFAAFGKHYERIDDLSMAIVSSGRRSWALWYEADLIKRRASMLASQSVHRGLSDIYAFEEDLRTYNESVLAGAASPLVRLRVENPS